MLKIEEYEKLNIFDCKVVKIKLETEILKK